MIGLLTLRASQSFVAISQCSSSNSYFLSFIFCNHIKGLLIFDRKLESYPRVQSLIVQLQLHQGHVLQQQSLQLWYLNIFWRVEEDYWSNQCHPCPEPNNMMAVTASAHINSALEDVTRLACFVLDLGCFLKKT